MVVAADLGAEINQISFLTLCNADPVIQDDNLDYAIQ